jgi:hypothetical protein
MKTHLHPASFALAAAGIAVIGFGVGTTYAQAPVPPNPYRWDQSWVPKLSGGRTWGSSAGVDVDRDGNIYVAERCGGNPLGCEGKTVDPILKFDPSGRLVKSFGVGLFLQPHGLYVDKDGNVWATDAVAKNGKGLQVFKFSPEGKVLMTLGKAGVSGEGPDTFGYPTAVAVAPNGDIFVADGHSGCTCPNARIVKLSKEGRFIKSFGKKGSGPGELDGPHALAFDSQGRLFVADRSNNRIEIFDQDGKFLQVWKQFSRPSGIFITRNDTLLAIDSESRSGPGNGNNPGWTRGIRIGSAKDGTVAAFIPDPEPNPTGSSGGEGIAEFNGIIYAFGDHRQTMVAQRRYVKK